MNKTMLCQNTGLGRSTVEHHLLMLQRAGQVVLQREGRQVLVFPPGIPSERRRLLHHLHRPDEQDALDFLRRHEPCSAKQLQHSLGLSSSATRRLLRRLVESGAVRQRGIHRPQYHVAAEPERPPQAAVELA